MPCSVTGPFVGPGSSWAPRTFTHRGRGTTTSLTCHMVRAFCRQPVHSCITSVASHRPLPQPVTLRASGTACPPGNHRLSTREASQGSQMPLLPPPPSPLSSASLPTGWTQL